MFIWAVALLMGIIPTAVVIADAVFQKNPAPLIDLIGRQFVFWGVGVRLATAGLRQIIKPGLTAKDILGIEGDDALILVQELGFGNLAIGILGIATAWRQGWVLPAALVGGLFYAFAGLRHIGTKGKNRNEYIACYSDLFMAVVMAVFFIARV